MKFFFPFSLNYCCHGEARMLFFDIVADPKKGYFLLYRICQYRDTTLLDQNNFMVDSGSDTHFSPYLILIYRF